MPSTNYDVNLRYRVNDRASKGLTNIERSAGRAAKSTGLLSAGMQRLMMAGGAFLGFRQAKKWLVDYNSGLDQSRITMGGLLAMDDPMGGFAENQKKANVLMRQFQDDAKVSVATTKDFVDFATLITGPLSRAGASMSELRDVTRGGVIAAKAFGIAGDVAARDIEQALAGTLNKKDRFARALLEPWMKAQGVTKDFTNHWNAFVKKEPDKAAKALVEAFNQPAIRDMAKAQEKSWAGVTSTLEDNLQRAIGAVGLPLMQAMSAEFTKLNQWFTDNPPKIAAMARSFSEGLVSGFQAAKKVMTFIIDNRRLLMTLAKAYLVGKVAGGLAGGIMAPFNRLAEGFLTGTTKLQRFTSGLGIAAAGLGALYVGFGALADIVDRKQDARIKRETDTTFMTEHAQALMGSQGGQQVRIREWNSKRAAQLGYTSDEGAQGGNTEGMAKGYFTAQQKLTASQVARQARAAGVLSDKGINVNQMLKRYGEAGREFAGAKSSAEMEERIKRSMLTKGKTYNQMVWAKDAMKGLEFAFAYDRAQREKMMARDREDWAAQASKYGILGAAVQGMISGVPAGSLGKDKINFQNSINASITIKNVVADDPDRFAFGLIGAVENIARNPTQARRVLGG